MRKDVKAIFDDIDSFKPERFVANLTPDATFRFANGDPVVGRENILEAVTGFFSTIGGLTHHVRRVWEQDDTVIAHIDCEYLRLDGKSVICPNADILVFDGDLVRDWQIFIDLAPVYA